MNANNKNSQLILAAILMEGLLILIWGIWRAFTDYNYIFNLNIQSTLYGLLAVVPLLLLNFCLFLNNPRGIFKSFTEEIIKPLCRNISFSGSIFISLAAGICEELFFRDFLFSVVNHVSNIYLAILINSLAFGVVHFIGHLKKYWSLAILYTLIGVFFSLLLLWSQSLITVIIAHAIYDFLAINLVRKRLSLSTEPL